MLDTLGRAFDDLEDQARATNRDLSEPLQLEDDAYYLGNAKEGSYYRWQLSQQLEGAKTIIARWHKDKAARIDYSTRDS